MADYEKASLNRAQTLAMMGVTVWRERTGEMPPVGEAVETQPQGSPADASVRGPAAARAVLAEPSPTTAQQPAAPPSPKPEKPMNETAQATEIIEFTWIKGGRGLVLHTLTGDNATLTLLKDVAQFADWRLARGRGGSGGETSARPATGDFRWPQLIDTSGTPLRALRAFFGKHLPQEGWLGVTADVLPQLSAWLGELDINVVELPTLEHNIGDAAIKREIWRQLIKLG